MLSIYDRHEVGEFGNALLAQVAGDEDIGAGEVKLFVFGLSVQAVEAEVPPLVGIQDAAENGGRVEAWQAHEVDTAGYADQGRGVQVADDAILLDGQVAVGIIGGYPGGGGVRGSHCSCERGRGG